MYTLKNAIEDKVLYHVIVNIIMIIGISVISFPLALFVAIIISIGKEFFDKSVGYSISVADLIADTVGIIIGSSIILLWKGL